MSTPTPRTDAQAYGVEGTAEGSTDEYRVGPRLIHVSAVFARTLERELAELISVNATGAARLAHATAQLAAERARTDYLISRLTCWWPTRASIDHEIKNAK